MVSNFCPLFWFCLWMIQRNSLEQSCPQILTGSHWVVGFYFVWFFGGCGLVRERVVWFCLFYFPCGISPFIRGQFWSPGIKVSNLKGIVFPKGLWSTLPGNCWGIERLPNKLCSKEYCRFSQKSYMTEQLKEHKCPRSRLNIISQWCFFFPPRNKSSR